MYREREVSAWTSPRREDLPAAPRGWRPQDSITISSTTNITVIISSITTIKTFTVTTFMVTTIKRLLLLL